VIFIVTPTSFKRAGVADVSPTLTLSGM
jgi:hypothetical protein